MTALDTEADVTLAVRPQPLSAFPLPVGYLLIPAGDHTEDARKALLAGKSPEQWPPALLAHAYALAGDRDAALAELRGSDPVTRYNRFVLDPDGDDAEDLRNVLGQFGVLVDVILFVVGRSDIPPELGTSDGELAATVLALQASHALAEGDPDTAITLLDRGAREAGDESPALRGVLTGAAASICRDRNDQSAEERFDAALTLLKDADGLRIGRAELHLNLAGLLHERAGDHPDMLNKSVPHYHSALQLILRDEAPLLWAAAHANLAAAYLTMPMTEASGQLRLGVAAQSLRSALKVYTREQFPEQWASVQLNLANSLVYTPSKHQADNLVEAVELYEAVLETRDRDADPLGRARVLANQGNALAHLGVFDQAKGKLYEARYLFEEQHDHDSVRAVRGVLDEIARQVTLLRTSEDGLQP